MIVTKHDLINIQELIVKQNNELRDAIKFFEDHSKLVKNVGDKFDEMKVNLELSERAMNIITDILNELDDYDNFVVIGKEI